MTMPTPIPASSIPQTTTKKMTWAEAAAACDQLMRKIEAERLAERYRDNPFDADAAELERLRKVEDEAADAFDRRLEEEQDGSYSIPVNEWSRWRSAREARIAFEAKIGGGV